MGDGQDRRARPRDEGFYRDGKLLLDIDELLTYLYPNQDRMAADVEHERYITRMGWEFRMREI